MEGAKDDDFKTSVTDVNSEMYYGKSRRSVRLTSGSRASAVRSTMSLSGPAASERVKKDSDTSEKEDGLSPARLFVI